jgi:hypothetical protein
MESLLLSVPLEVRLKIYKLVLDTGTTDSITKGRVYIVESRGALHITSSYASINDYSLVNVSSKSFALTQTCAQVRDEIQHYLERPTFQFTNTKAFMSFLHYHPWDTHHTINENNQITMQSAALVMFVFDERAWISYRVKPLTLWVRTHMMQMADLILCQ